MGRFPSGKEQSYSVLSSYRIWLRIAAGVERNFFVQWLAQGSHLFLGLLAPCVSSIYWDFGVDYGTG